MNQPVIKVEDLWKIYQLGEVQVEALRGVSFEIEEGEFVAIMGPSGSGKSTLMNILGCLDRPTRGRYFLDGQEVSQLNENQLAQIRNKKIGFIFQSFNLLPRLTALQNVELPLIYAGIPSQKRKEQAIKSLEAVGLGDRIHHYPNQLSGGQQQRVAIARALVNDPSIILADEPTGNLDLRTSEEIMRLLLSINAAGTTVIVATHDQYLVDAYRQRLVELHNGRLKRDERRGRYFIDGEL